MYESRINELNKERPGMLIYVFGHTHEATISDNVILKVGKTIEAFDTGPSSA